MIPSTSLAVTLLLLVAGAVVADQPAWDARTFCHVFPDHCPVDKQLVQRLDAGDLNDLNITYVFPTIPSHEMDHCTNYTDRGERVACVDNETRRHAQKVQAGVRRQLRDMPQNWFESYANFSIMPRVLVYRVHHADVVWRTCMEPYVEQVHQEKIFPGPGQAHSAASFR